MGGSFASGKEEALYLGGFSSGGTSSQTTDVGYVPLPGLITVDFADKKFRNISAAGYSTYSTSAWGGMHYIPMLGPNGVYIMIGGDTPPPWSYTYGDSKRKMDNITVYEPVTRQWFHQTTIGDEIPTPREHFCIVGMGEKASGSFEIFIYAGYDGIGRPPSPKYDELWVLTLPAFHYQKADYTSTHGRHGHTCSVIGSRYIFTYGGGEMLKNNFWGEVGRPDPVFNRGIGIFDMSKMTWVEEFDPDAAPYVRPNSFNDWYAAK
ncbi:hypothetical protein FGG08_001999 [Glutinoglossum americanum]|uniref:Uncharacterized protein n=1 Tax=Glutinoglossum americanum TaxID=1670608 RepID=A0A9P8ICF5_9PEZI|nr:hypothetical protein FGG08_001999 [Glutinoglossum americanum]